MIPARSAILVETHLARSLLRLCWSLAALLLGGACRAQVDGDGWLISAGGVSAYTYEMRPTAGQYQIVTWFTGPGGASLETRVSRGSVLPRVLRRSQWAASGDGGSAWHPGALFAPQRAEPEQAIHGIHGSSRRGVVVD